MIVYADASMLVKHYLAGSGSAQVDTLLRPPTITGTALITRAEVAAAFAKAARLGALIGAGAGKSLGEFRRQWPYLLRLRINEAVTLRAGELAWEHGLRGYDAVHLATALIWQAALNEALTLGTFDRQLWQAGRDMGLAVWPAGLA